MLNFELLGLLYASGTIRRGKNCRIEVQTKRKELAEIFYMQLSAIGKAQMRKKENGKIIVNLSRKNEIEEFLKRFSIILPLYKEKIPLEILGASKDRKSFLRGFFEGKSSVYPEKRLIRISGKKGQLEDIKKLLEVERINSGIYSTGKYNSLYIEGKGRCDSFRKIGFLSKEKNEKLNEAVGWLNYPLNTLPPNK